MSTWRLPEEIEVDIFLRLPVNSILACRCVCKPWCSLLTKPKFIKDHLHLTIRSNNDNNPRLMFGQSRYDQGKNPIISSVDYKAISSSSSVSYFRKMKVVSMEYPFENINTMAIVFLGSCSGLICLGVASDRMSIDDKNWICVWNPSTGEYMNIELHIYEFEEKTSFCFRYGFGYDSNIDDYKLVKISGYDNSWGLLFQVYTLGSKCWRTISIKSKNPYIFSGQLHENLHGVLINGVLHWSGGKRGISTKLIVSFDINEERFMDIPFPEETVLPLQQHQKTYREVGVLGGCLCVVFSVVGIRTDVWVMQDYGVRESWTKVFTTTQQPMTRDPFFKAIWSFESGDILVYSCGQLSLCNQNNGNTRKILFNGINMGRFPASYVESLVCLGSRTYVKKRTTNGDKKEPKRQRLRVLLRTCCI